VRKPPIRSICILAAVILLTLSGCAGRPTTPRNPPAASVVSSTPADAEASGSAASENSSASAEDTKPPAVSAKALAYADKIGGWDHKGQTLYFIVGASFGTERDAQAALDKAMSVFGDMQPYFIVQRSDSFAGMTPGRWVVVEAYRKYPSKENLGFGRRGFPDAHVERARVVVTAPIPVYEDLVGGD
jgi:hypothetical protein